MKLSQCPQETAVAKALCSGKLNELFTIHVGSCAICREILETSTWMQAVAPSSEGHGRLPDASMIWWKCRLSEKQRNTEKVEDFCEFVEMASAAMISLGLLGGLVWNWFTIERSLASILEGSELWLTAFTMGNVLLLAVAISCFIAFVLAYPILIDE